MTTRDAPLPVDMVAVMEQRQTKRDFSQAVQQQVLGEFLWLTCRSRSSRPARTGRIRIAAVSSAGAMHPIHVLVGAAAAPWQRYDAVSHVLREVPGSGPSRRGLALLKRCCRLVAVFCWHWLQSQAGLPQSTSTPTASFGATRA
jgi:hypothetical protein